MTSRLAAYVKSQFVGYDVDCEYNRMGNAQKRLLTLNNQRVYPDIIVHKRGTNEMNLLVIEAKKEGVSNRADILKLHAYKQDLHYQHACMVIFPSTPQHLHDEALSRYIQVY
ncbi:MAG TPA: hypothetical protein VD735_07660 [Candidatus Saccharimonadales bacterium]|nr:hypothetical protein [Candidatus Saccharimonadales bacterium]